MKRGWCLLLLCLLLLPVPQLAEQENPGATPAPAAQNAATPEPVAASPEPLMNPEDAQAAAPSLRAAEVAERMRHAGADADVTGNGVVDETDALAMLLHVTGQLPDLTALPDILTVEEM